VLFELRAIVATITGDEPVARRTITVLTALCASVSLW